MATDIRAAIEAVFRIEQVKLTAGLARLLRDVGRAEELAQDALLAALEQWPASGIPAKPGAWLMATAKHFAFDELRRNKVLEQKHAELGLEAQMQVMAPEIDESIGDELLGLIFTACHPLLSREAQIALTLRLLGGLSVDEIARAFLISPTTVQQRIVRAKKTLSESKVPFEVPVGEALTPRLSSVLEVVYLIFNEGYSATAGEDWMRPELCEDAMRLGRILAAAKPNEPEVHGLLALMEFQASRMRARTGPNGEAVLLLEQNRAAWDRLLINRGLASLAKVELLGGAHGPYAIQAALAACHARAATAAQTDWCRIVGLYDILMAEQPSSVVALNRAIAAGMAFGPRTGLEQIDALGDDEVMAGYPYLWAARADLLYKLERFDEAATNFEKAAALTRNERDKATLLGRATQCRPC